MRTQTDATGAYAVAVLCMNISLHLQLQNIFSLHCCISACNVSIRANCFDAVFGSILYFKCH